MQTDSCGCDAPPKRLCDLCYSGTGVFLACSLTCLLKHQRAAHSAHAAENSAERARSAARASNARFPDSWEPYAPHRQQVMGLIAALPQAAEICVLGAGNCSDLDLPKLASSYEEIHLVDLDGEALERSRDRQEPAVRERIVLHPNLDFSGFLEHLDDWGERFPSRADLGKSAVNAAQSIVRQLGRSFPTVVSTCVLSQLVVPFQRAWVTARPNWADLSSTLTAVHLATLAGSTARGGQALLVFDTSSSKDTPALARARDLEPEALQAFVEEARAERSLALRPEPADLVQQLSSPGLRALVADPELGSPWLWDLGDATQLVYSLRFRHP